MRRSLSGFTLIELLVVIAIIDTSFYTNGAQITHVMYRGAE
jgi:Tfp pilus assembly protein PilE